MIILGLTGSIGMGKSTTAEMFEAEGVPVHSADASVHRLYAGRAAPLIEAAFPGTVSGGVVDRQALSAEVLGDPQALKRLEAIVHPLVHEEEAAFLETARRRRRPARRPRHSAALRDRRGDTLRQGGRRLGAGERPA